MSEWHFTAQAIPKAQPRVRATSFSRGMVRMWTPDTADNFKGAVAVAASRAVDPAVTPIRDGWSLTCAFYLPRPKRLMGRRGGARERIPHTAKPDLDNLVKAALDAIVNSGVVHDDAQLYWINAVKVYAEPDGQPRAEFVLSTNTETVNG